MPELTISDQILLIGLGEDGKLDRPYDGRLDYAVSGASLIDLSFMGRIDTDLSRLFVVDASPTGNPLFDAVLNNINSGTPNQPTSYWVSEVARYAPVLRQQHLEDLVARGVLRKQEGRRLMVFKSERYPPVDPQVTRNIHRRLIDVLLSDEIPEPEEVALIGLVRASRLLELLLPRRDLEGIEPRIEQLAKMDLIGLSVNRALDEIQAAVALAMPPL